MAETMLKIQDPTPDIGDRPWVLILGGVSRLGNRRARRFAQRAAGRGHTVVWFDGFEEEWPDSDRRVPLSDEALDGDVFVVGYREAENRFLLNRVADFLPRLVFAPGSWIADQTSRSKRESVAHLGRRIRHVTRKLGEALRSKVLGKLAAAFRGRAGVQIVRPHLNQLAAGFNPSAIVFCDDFGLTIAWHAARIWTDVPVSPELPD